MITKDQPMNVIKPYARLKKKKKKKEKKTVLFFKRFVVDLEINSSINLQSEQESNQKVFEIHSVLTRISECMNQKQPQANLLAVNDWLCP